METKNGLQLIAEERNEQINKHGKTIEKDVKDNQNNQIVDAAMQYLGGDIIKCWPESWDEKWYKPGERIDELKKAGALIAAEIDRLLLIEQQNSK